MANITITIPDQYIDRVATALCISAGMAVTNANAKKVLIDYLKNTTLSYEATANEDTRLQATKQAEETYNANMQLLQQDIEAIGIS